MIIIMDDVEAVDVLDMNVIKKMLPDRFDV